MTIIGAAILFDVRLISEFRPPRWLTRLAWSLLTMPLISLTLLVFEKTQTALEFNSIIAMLIMTVNATLAFSAKGNVETLDGNKGIQVVRYGFLLMAAVVIVPQLMFQSVLSISIPMLNLVTLHAALSTVILFSVLTIRARQRDLAAQNALVRYELKERQLQEESERRSMKERFLAMLTHELRNPLTVIRMSAERSPTAPRAIHRAAMDMAKIIERVEQSEVLEAGGIKVEKTKFHLGSLIRENVDAQSERDRITVSGFADVTLHTDRELLGLIFSNLLDNATKYSATGSSIEVGISESAFEEVRGVRVTISNLIGETGVPDVGKLFTRYYRSKGAHRSPGSGLGLFLVAGWTKALGGNVSFEVDHNSNARRSASVSVWIPL